MELNKYILALLFSVFCWNCVDAQSPTKTIDNQEIVLSYNDSLIRLNICNVNPKVKVKSNLRYYWYMSHSVYSNQGGFSGHLLNGRYLVFDKDRRLRVDGNFKDGLKVGVWKTWNASGVLESEYTWEKGLRDGTAILYTSLGSVYKEIPYSDDVVDGSIIVHNGDKIEKLKYNDGVAVSKKVKKSTIQKVEFPTGNKEKKSRKGKNLEDGNRQVNPTSDKKPLFHFWPFYRKEKASSSKDTSVNIEQSTYDNLDTGSKVDSTNIQMDSVKKKKGFRLWPFSKMGGKASQKSVKTNTEYSLPDGLSSGSQPLIHE